MRQWLTWMVAVSFLALAGSCGDDDTNNTGADGGGGSKPVISKVAWMTAANCHSGVAGNYTITTTATDPDTATDKLTYMGTLNDCTPKTWTTATTMVNCPNAATYLGSMVVKDPENNSATQTFSISPCSTGMAP